MFVNADRTTDRGEGRKGTSCYKRRYSCQNGEFLIQDHTIRLLPSASVMKFLNKGSAPTQSLLVFGNPDLNDPNMDLSGAETEAKAIAKL